MPPRITLVFLVLTLGLAGAELKPAEQKNDAGLDFRIVQVPESVFSTFDPSSREGARKPKPGVRRIEGHEMGDFDVREFLSKYGVSFPAGSIAYDNGGVLVARDTAPNLALIDGIFGNRPLEVSPTVVSIEISTYECALPPSKKLLPWDELTVADVVNLPKGSARLVDRNSIVTKSGQRSVSEQVTNPTDPAKAKEDHGGTFHPGETGSLLEVEPVVGPDGETIDVNIAYGLRTKVPGAGDNGFAELKVITSFSSWSEYPVVIQSAPVEGQPGKYFVVVARAQSTDLNEFKLPPPKPGVKPGVVAPAPKGAGLPPLMFLKRYKVPPGWFNAAPQGDLLAPPPGGPPGEAAAPPAPQPPGPPKSIDVMDYLKGCGVKFPPGSKAIYDKRTNTLIIIDTEENLDLVDEIVDTLNNAMPTIISAELSAYECDFSEVKDQGQLDKLTFTELEKKPRNSVKVIDCVSVITKSGQRAVAVGSAGPAPLKEEDFQQQQLPQVFHAGETGTVLEVEPVVGPDGRKIDTDAGYEIRMETGAVGSKEIVAIKNTVTFTSESGEPRVVLVSPVKNHEGKYIVVVMRMRVLSAGGWSVKYKDNAAPPNQLPPTAPADPANTK